MGLIIGVGASKPTFPYDYCYGVEWDVTIGNKPKRIGKVELHKELPLQNNMRRCILNEDGTVNYYLHANDSTKRDNGAAADLTGAHGMYMVELPDTWARFERVGNVCRCYLSDRPLPGFEYWKKDYISAVQATVYRPTNTLVSVCNTTNDYRGGNNNASWDDTYRDLRGVPASSISLTNFRNYARKNRTTEWNCNWYATYKKVWWLFAVEYCTFNCQEAFNAALTVEGFKQGGLGAGVSNVDWGKWSTLNGNNPFIPCGYTNSLGNATGCIDFTMPTEYQATPFVVSVPSYRGIENPFGHVWNWTDGTKCLIQSEADGGKSLFYVCDEPADVSDSADVSKYRLSGELPRSEGYVKEICLGQYGEILPSKVGGGSTTYFCDYFYTNIPSSGTAVRGLLFGGSAYHGTKAGFVCATSNNAPSIAHAYFGSRLCFFPKSNA